VGCATVLLGEWLLALCSFKKLVTTHPTTRHILLLSQIIKYCLNVHTECAATDLVVWYLEMISRYIWSKFVNPWVQEKFRYSISWSCKIKMNTVYLECYNVICKFLLFLTDCVCTGLCCMCNGESWEFTRGEGNAACNWGICVNFLVTYEHFVHTQSYTDVISLSL
jgi:hypothetical protein